MTYIGIIGKLTQNENNIFDLIEMFMGEEEQAMFTRLRVLRLLSMGYFFQRFDNFIIKDNIFICMRK